MILIMIFAVTALLSYIVHKWYTVWQYSEQFSGQPTIPIIGNGHLLGNTSYSYLTFLHSETLRSKFEAFRVWVGHSLYIFLTKAEDVEIFLSNNKYLDKFEDYRFLNDWIGHGLITENGLRWFRQRRLITPAFHFKILNEFHPIMSSNVDRLVSKLYTFADSGKSFDAQHIINLATLDVICETAMGVQVHALDDPESELVQAFHDASYVVYQRIFSPWKRFDWLFPFSKEYQVNKKAINILHSFNHEVIAKRKLLLADSNNNVQNGEDIDVPKRKQVFIDMMLTTAIDGVPMSDNEISDEVSTFVFAGHDTTAAAITFGLYNLAKYPKEQQRVYEEQLSILGKDLSSDPTYQELQEMKYMEMFIKESQRITPAVALIGRHATENIKITSGKIIPKGSSVGILLYSMGHNPKTFKDPLVFNSDRFLPENRENKNPYELVPFSAGPRNCIGQKFANNEVRTVLAKLIRHFEILPTIEPFEPMYGATATTVSANGVHIRLKRRN